MSRTARLFQLMQAMRQAAPPVRAQNLAQDMDVSLRTIYRDIDSLRLLGAVIDGEAGYGYTLIEGATLPPLGFDDEEIEAFVLGLREVGHSEKRATKRPFGEKDVLKSRMHLRHQRQSEDSDQQHRNNDPNAK